MARDPDDVISYPHAMNIIRKRGTLTNDELSRMEGGDRDRLFDTLAKEAMRRGLTLTPQTKMKIESRGKRKVRRPMAAKKRSTRSKGDCKADRKRRMVKVRAAYKGGATKAARRAAWRKAMRHYKKPAGCAPRKPKRRRRKNPTTVVVVNKTRRANPSRKRAVRRPAAATHRRRAAARRGRKRA